LYAQAIACMQRLHACNRYLCCMHAKVFVLAREKKYVCVSVCGVCVCTSHAHMCGCSHTFIVSVCACVWTCTCTNNLRVSYEWYTCIIWMIHVYHMNGVKVEFVLQKSILLHKYSFWWSRIDKYFGSFARWGNSIVKAYICTTT